MATEKEIDDGLHRGAGALICIPTYNEAENIEPITSAVLGHVPEANVLVVDDNSPDGTGELADRLAAEDERIKVLHRARKAGLGKAYLAAFNWALPLGYRYIFQFDADFSHDPKHLPGFIGLLANGATDVVVGSRRVKGGGTENWGLHRRFLSWAGNIYARTVLGISVSDLTGGFNGFSRDVLTRIGLQEVTSIGYAFLIELKYRAVKNGFRVTEKPIIFHDRVAGRSKLGKAIFMESFVQVWKLRNLNLNGTR